MWHKIKPNASVKGLGRIISLACEFQRTTSKNAGHTVSYRVQRLYVRITTIRKCVATRQSSFDFSSPQEFWQWIHGIAADKGPITIVVSQSQLTVPAAGVFGQIDNGALRLEWPSEVRKTAKPRAKPPGTSCGMVCLSCPPVIITGRLCTGSIVRVLDVANWGIRVDDLRTLYDHATLGPDAAALLPKAKGDLGPKATAEAIELAVLWMVRNTRDRNLGMFRYTAASQAMAAWRHGRMGAAVVVHDEKPVQELERAGYFGGRCSIWYANPIKRPVMLLPQPVVLGQHAPLHVPTGPVYGVDVNGLFGSVMRDHLFPCRLVDWRIMKEQNDFVQLSEPGSSIAEVVIQTYAEQYPFKGAKDTEYPRGVYRTVLAGPELERAVRLGRVLRVGSWARYELADLFSGCIDEWWGNRLAATGPTAAFERRYWKLLINSLYGKWSQRRIGWVPSPGTESPGPWQQWWRVDENGKPVLCHRSIGRHVQKMDDLGPANDSFCAVAAFVTSYARLVLDRLREVVGDGHYYYQAIDSLYVSQEGYNKLVLANLVDGSTLGMLKQEGKWDEAHFIKPGHYLLDREETCSGRPLTATQDSTGKWTGVEFPSLDQLVTARPPVEPIGHVVKFDDMRTPIEGVVNAAGWVSPPTKGLKSVAGSTLG